MRISDWSSDVCSSDLAGDEAGALPLVAHALVETWLRRQGNTLTLEGFREAGGVAGAISQTAEANYQDQFGPAARSATKRLFLRQIGRASWRERVCQYVMN